MPNSCVVNLKKKWVGKCRIISGKTSSSERRRIPNLLKEGKINFVFSVDVYNEGVDICEINMILFLRPTESLTVYTQQLGRGLRRDNSSVNKYLTVIDFVGNYSKNYDIYLTKLSLLSRTPSEFIASRLINDNLLLPDSCSIVFKNKSRDIILDNIRRNRTHLQISSMIEQYKIECEKSNLTDFLSKYAIDPTEIYSGNRRFYNKTEDLYKVHFLLRLSKTDSLSMADGLISVLKNGIQTECDFIYANILYFFLYPTSRHKGDIWNGPLNIDNFLNTLRTDESLCSESIELLQYLKSNRSSMNAVEETVDVDHCSILKIGSSYYTDQIFSALGVIDISKPRCMQSGVEKISDKTMVLVVTLDHGNDGQEFTDGALDSYHFRWESQNNGNIDSECGNRLIQSGKGLYNTLLFVRISKKDQYGDTAPYIFLGSVECESYTGTKPFEVIWKTDMPIPDCILSFSKIKHEKENEIMNESQFALNGLQQYEDGMY